ncbi:hypothetical protein SISNIDRAFT_459307 [Sistotremastrum niveocremeum HHB9708]|uniref:Uncharacterized protein n=1 Tax=Sistotremastrum niveocremeum HHB9708 TaxID=1314777 RepID=A0A164PMN2_9AGAM|nr:hypothetical protein SISNIDRAFT_459307 [Sistotremastrum niveocremeum HHB9708]
MNSRVQSQRRPMPFNTNPSRSSHAIPSNNAAYPTHNLGPQLTITQPDNLPPYSPTYSPLSSLADDGEYNPYGSSGPANSVLEASSNTYFNPSLDGSKRRGRTEVERRCKERKQESLDKIREEMKLRGQPVHRTDGTQANLLFKAAETMKSERGQLRALQDEIRVLRAEIQLMGGRATDRRNFASPQAWPAMSNEQFGSLPTQSLF